MKIAVIGGGFTGLSCAVTLLEKGFDVEVIEESSSLGGLAGGIENKKWSWSLEYFYHHVFTNDKEIISLAKKVGSRILIKNPLTTSFVNGKNLQLDSPLSVLRFSELSVWGRIQMGFGLALLKVIPSGKFLEKYKVVRVLPLLIGKESYKLIWEKLLKAKFGPFLSKVNMAWFWTRVSKRTKNLGYPEGGFQDLADKVSKKIVSLGGVIRLNQKVNNIEQLKNGTWSVDGKNFDGVVITTPAPVMVKMLGTMAPTFPKIDYLWGQTMVLELKQKLIDSYWMNILEDNWPFLVMVEHTNLIKNKHYGEDILVYLGNYLPEGHDQLKKTDEELLAEYLPFLIKVNPLFSKKMINKVSVFRKPFAQPVFPVEYSRLLPSVKTKHRGLYVANMSMVYPFDRGTNYAVKMGTEVAEKIAIDLK